MNYLLSALHSTSLPLSLINSKYFIFRIPILPLKPDYWSEQQKGQRGKGKMKVVGTLGRAMAKDSLYLILNFAFNLPFQMKLGNCSFSFSFQHCPPPPVEPYLRSVIQGNIMYLHRFQKALASWPGNLKPLIGSIKRKSLFSIQTNLNVATLQSTYSQCISW